MPEFPPVWLDPIRFKAIVKEALSEQGYTVERADLLDHVLFFEPPVEGAATFATTDTYPKTIEIVKKEIGKQFYLEGLLDLTQLSDAEEVVLAEKVKVKTAGGYILYADEPYKGVMEEPGIHVKTIESVHGLSLELKMETAPAADRSFDYIFFVKKKIP